jgi:hypothetical protein
MNRMMQDISLKIKNYLDRAASSTKPTKLAAIHATVLSIIIGIFAAYFIYINGEIRTKQTDAMSEAEEINKIHFKRYFYFLKNKDTFMASGQEDMEEIKNLLIELALLTSMQPGGTNAGRVNIPKDPAERAERIVGIINIIVHRYPFPKAIDGNSGSFSQFRPNPIVFTDFEYLGQWLKVLDTVINILKPVTILMPLFYPKHIDSYLHALADREKENIEKAKDNLIEQIRGERNPYNIFNDFINGMSRVEEVYHSTLNALNRANELQSNLVPKPFILIILFSGFIIFIIGVVLPLSSISLNPVLYIHLPLAYYTFIFIMIIVKFASY